MSIGMAMRLARFNTMLDDEPQPEYWRHFFVGVPAPAAAAIAMMPVMISFDFPELNYIIKSHGFCATLLCIVSFLMVSRIPTFSTKKLKVPTYLVLPIMLCVVLFASFIISQPWLTLGIVTFVYILSLPLGVVFFIKEKKKFESK
jgi:CDP-diacylglycerol--serine O-phosphatidyltransferase